MTNLKNIKHAKCGECNKGPIYNESFGKCCECKIKFCSKHCWVNLYRKDKIEQINECNIVCNNCKDKFGYVDISEYTKDKDRATNYYLFKQNMYDDSEEFNSKRYICSFCY